MHNFDKTNEFLSEDDIRKAVEIIFKQTSTGMHIAWNLTIPEIVNMSIYEHFMRPRNSSKIYCSAIKTIRLATTNLENHGNYFGK